MEDRRLKDGDWENIFSVGAEDGKPEKRDATRKGTVHI
jgi:hypothetical protein